MTSAKIRLYSVQTGYTNGSAERRLNLNSTSETACLKKNPNLYFNTVKIHQVFFGTIYKKYTK